MRVCTIVIPVYNEGSSLFHLIEKVSKIDDNRFEFLFVDNGSTDEAVKELLTKKSSKHRSVRTENNLGFGGGILYGLDFCTTDYIGWMPGNLKVDPVEFVNLLKNTDLAKYQMIKARRVNRDRKAALKTLILGVVQSAILSKNMLDSGGTPTICRKDFIKSLRSAPKDYVFESYVLFQARKREYKIFRPKLSYRKRIYGSSHWQRGFLSEMRLTGAILLGSLRWRFEDNDNFNH